MIPTFIRDPDDPRIAEYRGLRDAALLRDRGLFVAEGRLVVERVLSDRRYVPESILLNPASYQALGPVLASAGVEHGGVAVFVCEHSVFALVTGYNIHRGCLALVRRPPLRPWQDVVAGARLLVILESVTNADNVGGVFRNAAAFGADAVLLSPTTCDPLYRKSVRTSMGAVLRVPFARQEPWPHALDTLKALGFTLVALSPRRPATCLDHFATRLDASDRLALLVGTEGAGLSATAEERADARVTIPTTTDVDSLNLAVATGIALSRLARL